jgi:hypothetical protein
MATSKKSLKNLVRANVNKGVTKKEDKRAGVIQSLIDLLAKKFHDKETLLAELKVMFPEREESSLKATIKAQLSGKDGKRLEKERGLKLKYKDIKGFVYFKIEGKKDWSEEENEDRE